MKTLEKALKEKIEYYVIYGCNTSGVNHFQPRYYVRKDGRMEELQWQPNPTGDSINDGGFWRHDMVLRIPVGQKIYKAGEAYLMPQPMAERLPSSEWKNWKEHTTGADGYVQEVFQPEEFRWYVLGWREVSLEDIYDEV